MINQFARSLSTMCALSLPTCALSLSKGAVKAAKPGLSEPSPGTYAAADQQ
jgi:hypothetical protein